LPGDIDTFLLTFYGFKYLPNDFATMQNKSDFGFSEGQKENRIYDNCFRRIGDETLQHCNIFDCLFAPQKNQNHLCFVLLQFHLVNS
jgi:hypothetical protein